MAAHSSTLAWRIPWVEEPVGCSPWGHGESDTTEQLHFHFSLPCTGEGNGNPLQCSCLENPRDGEPGGLPSMGLHRVGHNWSDLAAAAVAFVQHTQKGKPTKKYSSLKNLTLTTCKEDQRGHLVLFDGYLLFILLTRTHRFCSSFWFHQHQEA